MMAHCLSVASLIDTIANHDIKTGKLTSGGQYETAAIGIVTPISGNYRT
jgi:hypothetical protein